MRRIAGLALASFALAAATVPTAASAFSGTARVVGGSDTTATAVPYQALVRPAGYLCGGSVLDATHVLTAAHCVYDPDTMTVTPASAVLVSAGVTSRANTGAGQTFTATGVTVHPAYDPERFTSDAAILTLPAPGFDLNRSDIDPIALTPVGYRPAPSDNLRLSGWGTTLPRSPNAGDNHDAPATMLQIAGTLHTSTLCTSTYQGYDDDLQLCAGQANLDACQGDSGGPLAVMVGGVWQLAGIVSSGAGCAWSGFPGLYTRVSGTEISAFVTARGEGYTPSPSSTTPAPTVPVTPVPIATVATTPPPPAPAAAPPVSQPTLAAAPDTVAPTAKLTARCTKTMCILDVTVADPAPSSGVAGIDARVRTAYRATCGARKHRRRCTKTVTRSLTSVAPAGLGLYRVKTPRLRKGTQTFSVIARDGSGNRQPAATTLAKRLG